MGWHLDLLFLNLKFKKFRFFIWTAISNKHQSAGMKDDAEDTVSKFYNNIDSKPEDSITERCKRIRRSSRECSFIEELLDYLSKRRRYVCPSFFPESVDEVRLWSGINR